METSGSTLIRDFILLRYMYIAECGSIELVQRVSAQFENLNGHLRPALDPKPCSLARWTRSIHIQQNGAWRRIGGISI